MSVRSLGADKLARIAQLRAQMAQMGSAAVVDLGAATAPNAALDAAQGLADSAGVVAGAAGAAGAGAVGAGVAGKLLVVPGDLAGILPGGGLARQRVSSLNDCPALAVELATQVTSAGGYVAVVGWPELSLARVVEEGEPGRLIAVPEPGEQPWQVSCTLAEGCDLVIHHGPQVKLSPTQARPIAAKVRAGRAALLAVGPRLPGPAVELQAEVTTYRGIGRGRGRITGLDVEVRARAAGTTRRGVVTCGRARTLELA
ncbi:hypothetical protein G7Y31_02655 [Corynebacterium lizhenjunii]|uniref:Uncharacterized protein n=1 Tax=Corynebacterium lizhenjunii TaxID=2709394 RepID=A0A7T0KGD0_9CORY|nr:hypothetical protein [Corynebacterium lizhenjunii]QPK79629.1 hypothetical protein G7Y31_02655 [Corynebacterium lizhenjunii]